MMRQPQPETRRSSLEGWLHDCATLTIRSGFGHTVDLASDDSRLLVVELVIPPGNEPSFGKWLDVHMLVLLTGRERTQAEYAALFRRAGFQLTGVVHTARGPTFVEAVRG
jgi:hypothetical protein